MTQQPRFFWPGATPLLISMGCILAVMALFVSHLSGCVSSPLQTAQDSAQKAYALYGTFVIVEEQGAVLITSPNTPESVRQAIRNADAKAKSTADALVKALKDYESARASMPPGQTNQAQLDTINAHLSQWISQATVDVRSLLNAVHTPAGGPP